SNDHAVAGIFAAKARPQFNPLIVHLPDLAKVETYAALTPRARDIAEQLWPGPLTLVLPLRAGAGLSPLVSAGQPSLAVRIPAPQLARDLLTQADRPIAAPSANPSGRISPTTADHVISGLSGRIAAVLDGGACQAGVESTILDLTEDQPKLLRQGAIAQESLAEILGEPPATAAPITGDGSKALKAPGQLSSHYAPRASVRLNASAPDPGETLLGFGAVDTAWNLSPSGDVVEAAARLFALLHAMDADPKITAIAVSPIPETGLGRAINDRLRRAAAPRPN
ncbi:MAG: L-threonylcarbamoyladenylate synthase, partial [Mangrovicoccus sp.]